MQITDAQRADAEELLASHLRAEGRNWHPSGYALIIDRLDRLVELAERLCKEHGK